MNNHKTPLKQRMRNLTFAAIAGQAGCLTLVIVFSALLGGLWLDEQLGQRGPCLFGMILLSVPISLFAMLRLALSAISRIQLSGNIDQDSEIESSDTKEV